MSSSILRYEIRSAFISNILLEELTIIQIDKKILLIFKTKNILACSLSPAN